MPDRLAARSGQRRISMKPRNVGGERDLPGGVSDAAMRRKPSSAHRAHKRRGSTQASELWVTPGAE
jgi:hypothetical protein